ncbi:hypothetical protein KQX54_003098 [Cotesia glomerata]|uniref:Uncharacterized protein n=1 Tax=Cotesia glomerata TaxID=32391 RepID=A0AAV7IMZ4_COTGL|nr:hypothetical protein KQX54_003098 [Cotesia glomerata]
MVRERVMLTHKSVPMQVIEKKGFIKNDRQDLGDKKLALEMLSSSLLKTSRGVTGIKTERTRGTGTKGFSSCCSLDELERTCDLDLYLTLGPTRFDDPHCSLPISVPSISFNRIIGYSSYILFASPGASDGFLFVGIFSTDTLQLSTVPNSQIEPYRSFFLTIFLSLILEPIFIESFINY